MIEDIPDTLIKRWETQITWFKPVEFDSPDLPLSGLRYMNFDFVRDINSLRAKCKFPLVINSGYRTEKRNEEVGGKSHSAHLTGEAVDILCLSSRERYTVIKFALILGFNRVGIGKSFVHLDRSFVNPPDVCWLY